MACQCEKSKALIQEWLEKQGHERCWYYPEIFEKLAALYGLRCENFSLPPKAEFEDGCRRYQTEQYAGIDSIEREKAAREYFASLEKDGDER
jgi:hypothetical protein